MYWLLKTEPGTFSFADLMKAKKATWDGVKNATALQHIRAMKKGDKAIIYHTGSEKRAVGTAVIASNPYADPKLGDAKMVVMDITPGKVLAKAVTLEELKGDGRFKGSPLLSIGRLSVVPLTEDQWGVFGA